MVEGNTLLRAFFLAI